MANTYRTTRDIVIPAGTQVVRAPERTEYVTHHGDVLIAINKDATANLRFDLGDALDDGLIEVER
ncbi:hypothetical protein EVB78_031 [Rhizobium phage RHph_N1_15]|nr:hypothetical protein EVB78_031 [Rhizobium phage RHph_N1_15]QIG75093.1 hypothetical protein EVC15_031 [Rhizobium phage RHph_N2_6]